jgi:hypothetical protein
MSLVGWMRGRRTVASVTALVVLIAAPVTLAVLHNGFPLSDLNLQAKDVWVTNASKALVGRLNTQITELDGGVSAAAKTFDVLQNGDSLFVSNSDQNSLLRIDPSFATLEQKVDTSNGAEVTFGGGRIAIVRPGDGALWVLDASGPLQFDPKSPPVMKLGAGGAAAVGVDGTIAAASTSKHALYEIAAGSLSPVRKATMSGSSPSVTLVGPHAVALSQGTLYFDDGSKATPKPTALKLQQPGPQRDTVLVATGSSLLQVTNGGAQTVHDAQIGSPAVSPADIAAPVVLGDCIHGAWSSAHRYLGVCDGLAPVAKDVAVGKSDAKLQFRVNRDVVALNNVTDGSVWLVKKADIVDANVDWNQATPPEQKDAQQTDDTTSVPNFEQAIKDRSPQNHDPIARDDSLGARPGKTSILDVLANDTDPDGDVLTISTVSAIPDTAGQLELIQGGRALQFVAAPGFSGTASFRYTVSDGRGGVADANVDVAVRPVGSGDFAPVSSGTSAVTLEAGKTISYNVLGDWYDPDGDDLILAGASASNALVRFSPDGLITYTQLGNELGPSTVAIEVSDGTKSTVGQFIVDVKAPGSAAPIGTPDFATAFVGQSVDIKPLSNDLSPSGVPLTLSKVTAIDPGLTVTTDPDSATVSVFGSQHGTYYLQYVVAAGTETSQGLIRVDIANQPISPPGPTAVKDIAYVRPNQPVTLSVLDNDVSPSGAVLGIQSVTVPDDASRLAIQVLTSTKIKITAPSGMTEPVEFQYTISDGTKTSTAGVSVVPLPELVHHQAPIAADDTTKARVGDVASVSVLANDYHPDGSQMHLDPNLVQADVGDGLAFVTGDQVRLQAPSKPGQYTVTYRIYDDFSESSTAKVVFTVLPKDSKNNAAPRPQTITTRVFQGATVAVDVPLDGIDPDGDSVSLTSVTGSTLGEVADVTATGFKYQAYADKTGTDTFTYEVHDSFGSPATGQIRIGVIQRPPTTLAPDAVGDQVSIRPGRVSSVPVLLNDSDPNGYPITLAKKLLEVQTGLTAVVRDSVVVVTAPKKVGSYSVHYAIDNGHGGTADAFLIVKVATDAPLQPPIAFDQSVDVNTTIGKHTVIVDVLHDAQNPGGLVSDLRVTSVGPNKSIAKPNADGTMTVALGATRQAVAYQVTNAIDKLSATAFIVVPAYSDSAPPHLKSTFKLPQVTAMNTATSWKLADILDVPSGRPVTVTDAASARAGRQAVGVPMAPDTRTIVYTPEKDFRGNTLVTFKVSDKGLSDDPNATTIEIPVTVGDASFRDIAPTFANQTIEIQPGEAAKTFDLRGASSHPNPAVIQELTYQNFAAPTGPVKASLSGSTVSMSTDVSTPVGTTSVIKFDVDLGTTFSVPAQITVKVVKSTRPLPQTVDDAEPNGRSSATYTISPLTNDFNPFADQGKSLTITDVAFQGDDLGASGLTHTDSTVSVTTGTAKSGTINLIYTIRDATNSADREMQGRITVTVTSAPEPVTALVLSAGPQTLTAVFQPPTSSNGSPIVSYEVFIVDAFNNTGQTRGDCVPGQSCTFTGLTNGHEYDVRVVAINDVGTSDGSTSGTITPWGVPGVPTNPKYSTNSSTAPAFITPTWGAPADQGGGSLRSEWTYTQGLSGSGSGPSGPGGQTVGPGDYSFQVRVCNPGACSAYVSASVHIDNPPRVMTIATNGTTGANGTGNTKVDVTLSGYSANETVSVTCFATQAGGAAPTVNLGSINVTVGSSGSKSATYVCQYAVGPYAQVTDQYSTYSNVIPVP